MPDLKSNYDRYLLAALGVLAAAVGILIALSVPDSRDAFILPPAAVDGAAFEPSSEVATLSGDIAAMKEGRTWAENTNGASALVSRIYLLRDGNLVDILEAGNDLFPGIPNSWVLENQLDYLDASLPERDPDADGFTNLEEHGAKTNPRDSGSKPSEWTKLRLGDVNIEQMQLIFTGRDVKGRASINSVAATSDELTGKPIGPTRTYAQGDTVIVAKFRPGFAVTYEEEKTPFRLAGFRTEMRENPRITVDGKPKVDKIDYAVLESTSGDKTSVELEAGKPQTSPYSLASIVDTRPSGATFRVRVGDTFEVGTAARYKLVDVSEEKATIEDLGTGEKHVIPKAAPETPPDASTDEAQTQ